MDLWFAGCGRDTPGAAERQVRMVGGRGSRPGHVGAGQEGCPQRPRLPDEGPFLLSNQQMRGKTASLKKSTEKLGGVQRAQDTSLSWPEGLKGEDVKKCSREGTLRSKYNQQYHKLFKDIPLEEVVLKVCSCALQRDLLLQGRLYISPNWLCFHASLFGKDIKVVVIPVVSVQMIKKHKMARLLPNGLAITTNTSQKYVFVSLLSRDSVYDMLRRVCTHLQCCPIAEISDCEEEKLEEGPTRNGELRLWDYRLLKVFFVLICFLVMSSSYLAFRISQLEQQLCSLNWGGSVPGHR
ncbi:hypothetical protein G4228_008806 [Cervus hanglu yarkandensis]|nr:hypothetical protein G4228_008806 [Cervus hanglu yarkandensis]